MRIKPRMDIHLSRSKFRKLKQMLKKQAKIKTIKKKMDLKIVVKKFNKKSGVMTPLDQ